MLPRVFCKKSPQAIENKERGPEKERQEVLRGRQVLERSRVRVQLWDALFYAAAQFSGAISGVAIATYVLRGAPGSDAVRYAVTVPGV
jgi:hypothetical protein